MPLGFGADMPEGLIPRLPQHTGARPVPEFGFPTHISPQQELMQGAPTMAAGFGYGPPIQHPGTTGNGAWWTPIAVAAGTEVVRAIAGSGKGESAAETQGSWYTLDDVYSTTVPTRRSMGVHPHPHPAGLVHRRRRRRKLLTASDKADIAFITGTLGKGEMGRTAIAALLSRRMS